MQGPNSRLCAGVQHGSRSISGRVQSAGGERSANGSGSVYEGNTRCNRSVLHGMQGGIEGVCDKVSDVNQANIAGGSARFPGRVQGVQPSARVLSDGVLKGMTDRNVSMGVCSENVSVVHSVNKEQFANFNVDFSDVSDVECDDSVKRFATPITNSGMKAMVEKDVPKTTEKSVLWASRLFEAWRKQRNSKIIKQGNFASAFLIKTKIESMTILE